MPFLDIPFNTQTLKVMQNTAMTLRFAITQGGLSFDVSGYSVALATKVSFADSAVTWSLAGSVYNGQQGLCDLTLSSTQTGTAQTLIAELQLTKSSPASTLTPLQFYLEIVAPT